MLVANLSQFSFRHSSFIETMALVASPVVSFVNKTILHKLTQILSWCASSAVKDFSGMLCETDEQCNRILSKEVKNLNKEEI